MNHPLLKYGFSPKYVGTDGLGAIRVLCVGEAPGEHEDIQGRPLVGPAGKLFDRMVGRAKNPATGEFLWRGQFLLTNVVNFRPPNNDLAGSPWEQEAIDFCRPYLKATLEEFKPHCILAMGATAIKWFVPHVSGQVVKDWRGYVVDTEWGKVVPTYHPAFLLRGNFALCEAFQYDLLRAVQVAQAGGLFEREPVVYDENPSPREFLEWAREYNKVGGLLGFDIETPYSGRADEELSDKSDLLREEDDPSYTIVRISFSYKPRTAVSVPWEPPYSEIAKGLLEKPYPKAVWNCPREEQRILMSDLSWKEAKSIVVGDKLVGFDENVPYGRKTRRYKTATVTRAEPFEAEILSVKLSDGERINVTGDHKWLRTGKHKGWERTLQLAPGDHLRRLFLPWDHLANTRDHGYLAGFFDGEGCLVTSERHLRLAASQKVGPTLDRVKETLSRLEFAHKTYLVSSREREIGGAILTIAGGKSEVARFLGEVRPGRLLSKFSPADLGAVWHSSPNTAKVEAIEPFGLGRAVAIETDTSTYVLEGFGAHNCSFDEPRLRASGVDIQGDILDFMWAWHFWKPHLPYGLKYASTFLTDLPQWKHLSAERPAWYSCVDSDALIRCAVKLERLLREKDRWDLFMLHVVKASGVLRRMSIEGIQTDRVLREKVRGEMLETYESTVRDLNDSVPFDLRPRKVYKSKRSTLEKKGLLAKGRWIEVEDGEPEPPPKPPRTRGKRTKVRGSDPAPTQEGAP